MFTGVPVLAALAAAAVASPTPKELLVPQCFDSIAQITASGKNYNLSSGALPRGDPTVPVSGTFGIQLRFCQPTVSVPARANTLQVLVPGATYNTEYWDTEFQPDMYSYRDVRFAAAQGYATLNMARLGEHHAASYGVGD